jgi:hypothetical protein
MTDLGGNWGMELKESGNVCTSFWCRSSNSEYLVEISKEQVREKFIDNPTFSVSSWGHPAIVSIHQLEPWRMLQGSCSSSPQPKARCKTLAIDWLRGSLSCISRVGSCWCALNLRCGSREDLHRASQQCSSTQRKPPARARSR